MKNTSADNFTFEMLLISPISDIIKNLENNNYRDCDISWLNGQLKKFTSFALKTLGVDFRLDSVGSTVMNDFIKDRFLSHFNTLLAYFKSFD